MNDVIMITGPNGEPIGLVTIDQLGADGAALAQQMVAHCGDPAQLDRIAAEQVKRIGHETYSYAATVALRVVVEHVLAPLLDHYATLTGLDLRDRMKAGEEGQQSGPDGAR